MSNMFVSGFALGALLHSIIVNNSIYLDFILFGVICLNLYFAYKNNKKIKNKFVK